MHQISPHHMDLARPKAQQIFQYPMGSLSIVKVICLLQPNGSDSRELVRLKEKVEFLNPEAFYNRSLSLVIIHLMF